MASNIDEPFNISLLSNDKARLNGLLQVDAQDIFTSSGEFAPRGLYSNQIFGAIGEDKRMRTPSFIDIRTTTMHPKILMDLNKLKGLYEGILSGRMYAIWNPVLKDFEKSTILDGDTGYSFFMSHFLEIDFKRNDSDIRDQRIDLMTKYKDKCMYRYVIVIPAGLRDVEVDSHGHTSEPEINTMYRKLLRASNTLPAIVADKEDKVFDTVRWSLQSAFNDIYLHIQTILEGKTGFIQAKWASRNVDGGSRNVITAINPAPQELGSAEAIDINDTIVGLHQYLKTTTDLSIYNIKQGPMKPILDNILESVNLIDRKTLKSVFVKPSAKEVDRWSSVASIEKLINGYAKLDYRHKPVTIDGYYVALIYRDDKSFKVFYDIDELPKEFDKGKVKPITWTEMYYISVFLQSRKVAGFVTRYPITGIDSIYPTMIYLKTTSKSESLFMLDDNWQINESIKATNMPITGMPFYDSMSVQTAKLPGLVADHDGDKTSLVIVTSDESVKELTDYLNSKKAFLDPNGGLKMGANNPITSMVLYNLTHGVL